MTWKNFFAYLETVAPPLVVAYVSKWLDLFRGTLIMRPAAGAQVEQTALAVSTVLVIVLALLFRHSSSMFHRNGALILLIASALLFFSAYWLRTQLGYELSRNTQENYIRLWDFFAWLFIVTIIQMVLFALMYANGRFKGKPIDL
ncbi:MAG: hypothetical protein ACOH2J_12820 [Allorhizobium sp.]